jgi:SNF2 family DNA or RNA helicase
MLLDYNPATQLFILRVPRGEVDISMLMTGEGWNFSTSASTADEATLFTDEAYAAASYFDRGTPAAREMLAGIVAQVEASRAPDVPSHFSCPPGRELWPFQRASLAYALERQHCLVADEPGLGKTMTAICYANERRAKRTLIICPANIRLQWAAKIYEWSTMPWGYHVHVILDGRHGVHPTAAYTVVSYDLARTPAIGRSLAKQNFDVIILDEAHYVKTNDSKRTRAIFGGGEHPDFPPLFERTRHVLALTGTPLPNRPREAYTLARHLCWEAIDWASEEKFRERYNPSLRREGRRANGTSYLFIDERTGRHGELQNRLRGNFMARHLKRDVLPQLKLPVFDLIRVEETKAVKQALRAESMLDIDPEQLEGADATILGHIASVRRTMGIAMAPQVAEYVSMLLDGGETKLVVFAWHIEVLDILETALAKARPIRIDGSVTGARRHRLIGAFIEDPAHQVLLGNMQSMGTGTDGLQTVSTHALIAEPSWTPGENQQAVDRLDRGGQTGRVQADFFVAPGSLSERVLASALRKHHTLHQVLDRRGDSVAA